MIIKENIAKFLLWLLLPVIETDFIETGVGKFVYAVITRMVAHLVK